MAEQPIITSIEITAFEHTVENIGRDASGLMPVYEPGRRVTARSHVLQIHTSMGITGEALTSKWEMSTLASLADYLKGKNALERERINQDIKRALRQIARVGMAAVDVPLWDIAGKYYNAPIWQLLGGHIRPLKCYASSMFADHHGGLDSPEAYADFAEQCLELGYSGFKVHGYSDSLVDSVIGNVHALGKRVGGKMDLMLDLACELNTFADAVKAGRACDDERFFWLEDPYKDGGISQFAHRKLRQLIRTPILETEHVRTLEPHVDFALAEATDFLRGDVWYDGITGVMKLAHAAEGLGLDIELHGAGPAQRHIETSLRNTNYYEMVFVHPKVSNHTKVYLNYRDGLDAIDDKGCVYAPEGPGLGVELDWDYIKKHTVEHTTL